MQIIHKNKQKIKKIFLILQHRTLKSTVVQYNSWLLNNISYVTTAFMLTSGHPGLETKTLYYCTLYSTQKHSHS